MRVALFGQPFCIRYCKLKNKNGVFKVKKVIFFALICLVLIFTLDIKNAGSWGFDAHKKITELAIDIILNLDEFEGINEEKLGFIKSFLSENKSLIIERCIEPDMIRNEDKDEQYNHFIDIDRYGKYPFDDLPRDKAKAIEKFGFEKVQKNGFLPWRIAEFSDSLAHSISKRDKEKMLKYFSWLAHYVEDAHQPLHVTENYDGQLTNQPGIHSRFETELVNYLLTKGELKFNISDLSAKLKKSAIVKDKMSFSFDIVLDSYKFIGDILNADSFAKSQIPPDKLYRVEKRNGRTRYIYSQEYYSIMADKLKSLVHERMSKSAIKLAVLWLSSAVDSK